MIAKPSPLERRIAKYVKTTARQREKQARKNQAERKWRALSAMVCHRDGGKCRVCGVTTKTTGDPRLIGACHHIVFRSAGGRDTLENCVWLCGTHHAQVHTHTLSIDGTAEKLSIEAKD